MLKSNYIYDLDNIKDFIFGDNTTRNSDVEITETQIMNDDTGKLETESKITREVKSTDSNHQTLRYDLIKTFMGVLDDIELDQNVVPVSFGQQIVLNTMSAYQLIKEIKD